MQICHLVQDYASGDVVNNNLTLDGLNILRAERNGCHFFKLIFFYGNGSDVEQYGYHFADNRLKFIFLFGNRRILIESLWIEILSITLAVRQVLLK